MRLCRAKQEIPPFSRSYDVRLDDGTSKSYAYWFADLREA